MKLGLSGTGRLALSGTRSSTYQEPYLPVTHYDCARNRRLSNHANRTESFGFFLTASVACGERS